MDGLIIDSEPILKSQTEKTDNNDIKEDLKSNSKFESEQVDVDLDVKAKNIDINVVFDDSSDSLITTSDNSNTNSLPESSNFMRGSGMNAIRTLKKINEEHVNLNNEFLSTTNIHIIGSSEAASDSTMIDLNSSNSNGLNQNTIQSVN